MSNIIFNFSKIFKYIRNVLEAKLVFKKFLNKKIKNLLYILIIQTQI